MLIGISGSYCSGKAEVAKYLQQNGFTLLSYAPQDPQIKTVYSLPLNPPAYEMPNNITGLPVVHTEDISGNLDSISENTSLFANPASSTSSSQLATQINKVKNLRKSVNNDTISNILAAQSTVSEEEKPSIESSHESKSDDIVKDHSDIGSAEEETPEELDRKETSSQSMEQMKADDSDDTDSLIDRKIKSKRATLPELMDEFSGDEYNPPTSLDENGKIKMPSPSDPCLTKLSEKHLQSIDSALEDVKTSSAIFHQSESDNADISEVVSEDESDETTGKQDLRGVSLNKKVLQSLAKKERMGSIKLSKSLSDLIKEMTNTQWDQNQASSAGIKDTGMAVPFSASYVSPVAQFNRAETFPMYPNYLLASQNNIDPKHTFTSLDQIPPYIIENSSRNFIIIIREIDMIKALESYPFFLHISIDAPIGKRYSRYLHKYQPFNPAVIHTSNPSTPIAPSSTNLMNFQQFVGTSDEYMYSKPNCRITAFSKAKLIIINDYDTIGELYITLSKLDLSNTERLRPSWDSYFMRLASLASHRSNCIKRRVGCVIVNDKRVVSTGYNGTPRGLKNCNEGGCGRCNNFNPKNPSGANLDSCLCLHAEENALLEAGRGRVGENSIIYCNTAPCLTCSIKIVQIGIKEVVYEIPYSSQQNSQKIFEEANVIFRQFVSPDEGIVLYKP